jgi:hypothetical protein
MFMLLCSRVLTTLIQLGNMIPHPGISNFILNLMEVSPTPPSIYEYLTWCTETVTSSNQHTLVFSNLVTYAILLLTLKF